MSLPAAVLFDNDGLLLDTEVVWTRAEEVLFDRRGREFTQEHKRELIGCSAERAGAILAQRLGEPGRESELIAELDELVFEEIEAGVEPMPGGRELVTMLAARRVPMALVSNSPLSFLHRALELVGMSEAFGAVVSGHEVDAPKPEPHPYQEACKLLGVEPAESVALEDSATGVTSARAAGAIVIGVPSFPGVDLSEADFVFDSLHDPRLARQLGLEG